MAYDFVVFDDLHADAIARELQLGPSVTHLEVSTKAEFESYLASEVVTDVAICDLRWVEQDGEVRGGFDGVDILLDLELGKLCRHAIVLTDGGEAYRHLIEEAKRSPIVSGGIRRRNTTRPAPLPELVDGIRKGSQYWDISPEVREPATPGEPAIVVDLLGYDHFTADGDLVRVMLESPGYDRVAAGRFVNKQTIKKQVPKLVQRLRGIGEHLEDTGPEVALAGWIGANRDYLLGWRRRVDCRLAR